VAEVQRSSRGRGNADPFDPNSAPNEAAMQFLTDGVSLEQAVARITQIMGD
jgi:hypothetical protein